MGVEVRFTKWGGIPHWRYTMEDLGVDRYGRWLGGRTGIPIRCGDAEPFPQPFDFVTLVPADGCWIGHWNSEADVSIYIDVSTRPSLADGVVHAVDLDLDVVRMRDGTVRVLDEDEFAEHQVRYGYPAGIVAQARATTDELAALVAAGAEPFGSAGDAWLARYAGHG